MENAPPPARRPDGGEDDLRAAGPGGTGPEPEHCPRCGSGDLVALSLRRAAGELALGVYCAGSADPARPRRRRPSCGYAGVPAPASRPEAAGA